MSKNVTLVPVVAANVLRITSYPNLDSTWNITASYQVLDNTGAVWKQAEYKTVLANGTLTLNGLLAAGLSAINSLEGL
jgi:hypothetical protein